MQNDMQNDMQNITDAELQPVIISLDAETVGLYGRPFSIAAVKKQGDKVEIFEIRRELAEEERETVKAIDSPTFSMTACVAQSNSITNVAENYEDMLAKFGEWYNANRVDATFIWHMGNVVEAFLFRELVRVGAVEMFDGPATAVEVSTMLQDRGLNPWSVDDYNTTNSLTVPCGESPHHPLYDSWAALVAYEDMKKQ